MSEFFQLHQKKDLVLFCKENQKGFGVILGYGDSSYVLRSLSSFYLNQNLELCEEEILQKIGELDFEVLHDSDAGFDFSGWVEIENDFA